MLTRQVNRLKLTAFRKSKEASCALWKDLRNLSTISQSGAPDEEEKNNVKSLREWRRPWAYGGQKLTTKLKVFDRRGRPSTDAIAQLNQPWDLRPSTVKKWLARKREELEILNQRFVPERHQILGSNLAAAHFLVHRGAKVKFVGKPEWVEKDKEGNYTLPDRYEPRYLVEAIDANGMKLYYDGLGNMRYLHELKWLSLKGCKPIDDWCLDRISSGYTKLEYLDISECEKVTERGLEALYRMHALKKLIVTNYHNSPAFELTCMMLEDCCPHIVCEIRKPEEKAESVKS